MVFEPDIHNAGVTVSIKQDRGNQFTIPVAADQGGAGPPVAIDIAVNSLSFYTVAMASGCARRKARFIHVYNVAALANKPIQLFEIRPPPVFISHLLFVARHFFYGYTPAPSKNERPHSR